MMATDVTKATQPRRLALSEIEAGLRTLWSGAAARTGSAPNAPSVRICTLNLVVYVSDSSEMDHIEPAATSASASQPMRVVLLTTEPDATQPKIEAEVSGYCRSTDGGTLRICCEQIILNAKGSAVDVLPASTNDLLMPDLPVVLWWTGKPPFGSDLFQRFEAISDYVVINSREFECTSVNLLGAEEAIKHHPQVGMGDINWAGMNQWREATADVFDDEDLQAYLGRISELSVAIAGDMETNMAQAMLFVGWLGGRLGWSSPKSVSGDSSSRWEFVVSSSMRRDVRIRVKPVAESQIEPGDLACISIQMDDQCTQVTLSRMDTPNQIRVTSEGMRTVHRTLPFELPSLGKLLTEEVEAMGADAVYEEALAFASSLMAQVEACDLAGQPRA